MEEIQSPKELISSALTYLTDPEKVTYFQEEFQGIFEVIELTKLITVDADKKINLPVHSDDPAIKLVQMKKAHDALATVANLLKTRRAFPYAEIVKAQAVFDFFCAMRDQVKADIEVIEPPKPKEPQKPYIIDALPDKSPA